ncbi:avidin-related protein 4/5-like isoform X2 [Pyxicephalus adspersus]|uniref:avidin-related protein 4/5-like isoform X2 n=1 Tax=Pyxicephalus adspersus TaxID=30357 RepID=UPI003B5936FF
MVGVVKGFVLCLVLLCTYCSAVGAHCNLTGVWVNTLGSVLTLHADGLHLIGSLHSSVELYPGAAGDKVGKLMGILGQGQQPTFSMCVSWRDGETVTAWVGQCFLTTQCPVLKTFWLLRSQATEKDNWQATRIGEDLFHPKNCDVDDLA